MNHAYGERQIVIATAHVCGCFDSEENGCKGLPLRPFFPVKTNDHEGGLDNGSD